MIRAWLVRLFTVAVCALVSAAMLQSAPAVAETTTYYVSPYGNDSANGRSPATAWRTINKVNSLVLTPGTQVLFQGGANFKGMVYVGPGEAGDEANLVRFGSYGSGRATISNSGAGVFVNNVAGVAVADLNLVGPGPSKANSDGITFYNDAAGGPQRLGVNVQRVDVSGFRNGISFGAAPGSLGFGNVVVADSVVRNNRRTGLVSYGAPFEPSAPNYSHRDITVTNVEAAQNLGDSAASYNTGNGIAIGSVSGARIVNSTAHDNGSNSAAGEGPVGIWAYDATGVVIEGNLSYNNKTRNVDGGGFDLDQNVSNSVVQYNLSYGNAGYGYLIYTAAGHQSNSGNTVRFNASVDDGRNGKYGAITIWGGSATGAINNASVYNNTVIVNPSTVNPPALRLEGALSGVKVMNNIFSGPAGSPLVSGANFSNAGIQLRGNDYYSRGGALILKWNSATYNGLPAFRTATGQESLNGAPVGTAANPVLSSTLRPINITLAGQIHSATGLKPMSGSPMVGGGVNLTLFGISRGTRDYFGTELPSNRFDIGAAS